MDPVQGITIQFETFIILANTLSKLVYNHFTCAECEMIIGPLVLKWSPLRVPETRPYI